MHITQLYAGKPAAFGPKKILSSIVKQPYEKLTILIDGAIEDEQGNKKLHGGPEMALHQYSHNGYATLIDTFPEMQEKFTSGSIGENISASDMDEDNVFIGDIYSFGEVHLQVSSPRAPCSNINFRYANPKTVLSILNKGNTGWYFRVVQTGSIKVNDKVTLQQRNQTPVSVKELMFLSTPPPDYPLTIERLKLAESTPGLAPEWQGKIQRQIKKLERKS